MAEQESQNKKFYSKTSLKTYQVQTEVENSKK